MKYIMMAAALLFAFAATEANAESRETWICLKNGSNERKLIFVEDVDNYDWDGVSRPDRNWNGTYVEAGQTRCERAEYNTNANSKSFSFVIPGRDIAHKIGLRLVKLRQAQENGGLHLWMAKVNTTIDNSILLGSGETINSRGLKFQTPSSCLTNNKPDCSLYTIQDIP